MTGPQDFGVTFDGATDDTAALQDWVDAGAPGVMPIGVARISAPILIRPAGVTPSITIRGSGRASRFPQGAYTEIRQDNDCPIFVVENMLSGSLFSDFVGSWGGNPTGLTGRVFFRFAPTVGPASWFNNVWDNLTIVRGYRGWEIAPTPGEMCNVWGNRWSSILADDMAGSVWDLRPTVANGQPINTFQHIYVNNANGTVVPDGPVFHFAAVEATILGLDIEGWTNSVLYAYGGFSVDVTGCHIEHHKIDATTTVGYAVFRVAGGTDLSVRNVSLAGTSLGGQYGLTVLAAASDDSHVTLEDVTMAMAPTMTGVLELVYGPGSFGVGQVRQVPGTKGFTVGSGWGGAQNARLVRFGPSLRSGLGPTANRPSASAAGKGAQWYDAVLGQPVWSNGSAWCDATGTAV